MRKLMVVSLLSLVIVACTGAPPPVPASGGLPSGAPVVLTLWHAYGGSLGEQFEALVAEFNATHPGIRVEPSYGGTLWTMRDKLLTAIGGNAGPDISQIDQFWSSELAEAGAIVKLQDYIDRDPDVDAADIFPKAWATATYDGEVWSMPFSLSNIALYYNRNLFRTAGLDPDAPPQTWDDLVDYGQALTQDTDGNGTIDQWGLSFPLQAQFGTVYYWFAFLWQAGGEIFNADYTAARFDAEPGVEALEFWVDLVHKYDVVPLAPPEQGFETGQIAMTFASTARLQRYIDALGSDNLGMAPLPHAAERATGVGGANLAILAKAVDKDAAWEFVKWMTSPDVNLRWSMATGYLPLRQTVVESATYQAYLADEPRAQVIVDQMPYGVVRPNIPAYAAASREIGLAVEEAVYGNLDPEATLSAAAEKVDALLR
jgi:multiple sugar transport system substrate-binding protein